MAVCRISLNRDANIWTSSVYTKNATPVELYHWMISRFDLNDDRLLSISVHREQQRSSYSLKRSQSIPRDSNNAVRENPFWYTIRVMHRYDGDDAVTAETVFQQILDESVLGQSLSPTEEMDSYEATFSGAIPARRLAKDGCKKLNRSEKASLMEVLADEAKAIRKEKACNDEFQAYIAENGIDSLSVKIMRQFAMKYLIVGGHWTIYAEATPKIAANGRPPFNSARVDVWQTWKQLLKGFLLGPLAASRATALSFKRTEDGRSMAISNPRCMAIQKEMTKEDPLDDEVLSVDKAIRSSGYKGRMKYKPDAFSVCQITHSNQRVIRPTIYLSEVNQFTGERITTDYTRDYTPEVRMGNHSAYRRQQSEAVGSSPDASPSIRRHQSASSASQMSESLRVVTPQQMQSTDSFSSSNTTVCGPSGFGRGQAGSRRPTAAVWATSLKPG